MAANDLKNKPAPEAPLSQELQNAYDGMMGAVERASQKDPGGKALFEEYARRQHATLQQFQSSISRDDHRPVDKHYLRTEYTAAQQRVHTEFLDKLNADQKQHMSILSKEMDGEGFVEKIVKRIYNEEKGGFQLGGMLGGAGGLAAGMLLGANVAAMGGGGILGALAIGVFALSGLKLGSDFGERMIPPTDTPKKLPDIDASPSSTRSQQQETSRPIDDNVKKQVDESKGAPARQEEQGKPISPGETGQFMPLTHTTRKTETTLAKV